MPELPDMAVYVDALERRIVGETLERIRLVSPFLLRSVAPPLETARDRSVLGVRGLGKRLVIALDEELFIVLHLMIAGRLRWRDAGAAVPKRLGLAAFDFTSGTLILTEAGSRKRAALHVVKGEDALRAHDRGGVEVLETTLAEFAAALRRENHTLKRALTDPRLFSGIGNAYSDEILHAAGLSPVRLTSRLTDRDVERLFAATRATLTTWIARLTRETGDGFPTKVTAFRAEMAVHGRYNQPCPVSGSPVQRIVYASNEANHCATCQTGGKLLADRAMSRLLKSAWPRTLEAWEDRKV
jgi:formamidopyrimidine-DNA glycosylase